MHGPQRAKADPNFPKSLSLTIGQSKQEESSCLLVATPVAGSLFSGKYRLRTWCGFAMMDLNNLLVVGGPAVSRASNVGKSCCR